MTSINQELGDESLRRAMRETAIATQDEDLYDFDILVRKAGQAYWRAREKGLSAAAAELAAADSADDLKQSEIIRKTALENLGRSELDRYVARHFVKLLVIIPPAVAMVAIAISWIATIVVGDRVGYAFLIATGGLWLIYGFYGFGRFVFAKIQARPAPSHRGGFALSVAGAPYGFALIIAVGWIVVHLFELNTEESLRKLGVATGVLFSDPEKFPSHSLNVLQKERLPSHGVVEAAPQRIEVAPGEATPGGATEERKGKVSSVATNSVTDTNTAPPAYVSSEGSKVQKIAALPDKVVEDLVHQFTNANWINVSARPLVRPGTDISGTEVLTANLPWDPRLAVLRAEIESEGIFKDEPAIAMYVKWPWNRGDGKKYATYVYGQVVDVDYKAATLRMGSGKVHKVVISNQRSDPGLTKGALVVTWAESRSSNVHEIGRVDAVAERVSNLAVTHH